MYKCAAVTAFAVLLAGCSGGTTADPSKSAPNGEPPATAASAEKIYSGLKFPATAAGFVLDKCPAITSPLLTSNAASGASQIDVRYMEPGVTLKSSAPSAQPQPQTPAELQCRFADDPNLAPAIDVNVYSFATAEAAQQYAETFHLPVDAPCGITLCARLNGTALWMTTGLPAGDFYDNWHAPSQEELSAALNDIVDHQ